MDYQQTLDYLFNQLPVFQRIGAAAYKKDLKNTNALCKILGNPERKFNSIHIAGTNGKGSVSHIIASVLQSADFKTGLYTSPHLKDFRERIRIDGEMIPKQYVVDFVDSNKPLFQEFSPSFFEYTFALAMQYFAENNVDIAVVETGMGGRLDSTNVVYSILTAITNISLDHTAFLGETLEKIAFEKAGIIKKNIPVIIGETQDEITHVFKTRSNQLHAPITFADREFQVQRVADNSVKNARVLNIRKKDDDYISELNFPLSGNYQLKNVVTAIAIIDALCKQGVGISKDDIFLGFKNVITNTGLLGRWQTLAKEPLTICDTGHNVDGVREIVKQLNSLHFANLHFVLGVVNDKEIDKILSLLPQNAMYYFCKADIPRGMDQDILLQHALRFGLKGRSHTSVKDAFKEAKRKASAEDLIFIGGSTFVVAEII